MMLKTKTIMDKQLDQSNSLQVKNASYLDGYKLRIFFNDGKENIVDFSNFILHNNKKYLERYKKLSRFKKFKIEGGNIVWGKDWDLIFPITQLYEGEIHTD